MNKFSKILWTVSLLSILSGFALADNSTTAQQSLGNTTTVSEDTTPITTLQGFLEHQFPDAWLLKQFTISGYLDLTYEHNFNNPQSGNNNLRVFDTQANGAAVRMFQIMIDRQTKDPNDVGFRVKLDLGDDAKIIAPYGTSKDIFDVEEMYLSYKAPLGNGLDITFGKWATPMGAEVIESKDNYNISRSFLYGYAEPFTHTGLKLAYPFSNKVSALVAVVNGWDNLSDNNDGKSGMAQITLTPNSVLTLSFCGMYGPEEYHNNHDNRAAFDFVGTYKATDKLTLVGNYDYGNEPHASVTGTNASWQGLAGYANYAFTPKISVTGRMEWFSDPDGARTGTPQDLAEGTLTGEYKWNDNLKFRLEYRHDHSNAASFENSDGGFGKEDNTVMFETLFIF